MKYFCLPFVVLLTFVTLKSNAQVLFEGYSKITLGGEHIGFVIQRYEFDTVRKNFIGTSFIKYNDLGGGITESLKEYANEALEPVSYTYNSLDGKTAKTIEAKTEKGKLKLTIIENGKKTTKEKNLPKGSFFSNFLAYVILKNPAGMKVGALPYSYEAVAEEDGEIYHGTAKILSEETHRGLHVFKVLNDFKNSQFVSYTTEKGEMITTQAPQKALSLELVTDPLLAMGSISVNKDNLRLLFGNLPEGRVNALASEGPNLGQGVKTTPLPTSSGIQINKAGTGQPTEVQINKPESIKALELQSPVPNAVGKQGTKSGLGIQTKSK